MNSRRWLITFVITVSLLLITVAGFNMFTDPFGVFGDRHYNWYSNSMTQNPRIGKIEYLNKNYEKYDSYILGASGAGSLSPEALGRYTGGKYYNLFVYGADMYDTVQIASYILNNYEVKNIVLNLGAVSASTYRGPKSDVTQYMHAKVTGSSKVKFYGKYLMANPNYGIAKIKDKKLDTFLQQPFDVFNVEDGTYDKSVRDAEAFGDIEEYYEKYPEFVDFKIYPKGPEYVDECIESARIIKEMCDEKGVTLTIIFSPMYGPDSVSYSPDQFKKLIIGIAEITDFWDFTFSSVSSDPRYFYDATHFRNAVGRMMLAKMFGDKSIFIPVDMGCLVTKDNAEERAEWIKNRMIYYADNRNVRFEDSTYSAEIPILMYHHLADEGEDSSTISPEMFEKHIKVLWEEGYEGITTEDLTAYVEKGVRLPDKPILITFDDGYMSNYEIAYPILKKYNMKATIFVIGVSLGKDVYKNSNIPIIPHFGEKEIKEMMKSGLISIQSHTFDMHQSEKTDGPNYRSGILQKDGESEGKYIEILTKDIEKSKKQLKNSGAGEVIALAYPNGLWDRLSEVLLYKNGIKVTLLTDEGTNVIVAGLPQTLRCLKRIKASDDLSPEELLNRIQRNE